MVTASCCAGRAAHSYCILVSFRRNAPLPAAMLGAKLGGSCCNMPIRFKSLNVGTTVCFSMPMLKATALGFQGLRDSWDTGRCEVILNIKMSQEPAQPKASKIYAVHPLQVGAIELLYQQEKPRSTHREGCCELAHSHSRVGMGGLPLSN